jgi:hypothetical protein
LPVVAGIVGGFGIGWGMLDVSAPASTFVATVGLIGVYYLQLRMMFECKDRWFGDWAQDEAGESDSSFDEEEAFLKMIEEEG